MKTLAEEIFIELIKIHESNQGYMKATRENEKEKGMSSYEILAYIAFDASMEFRRMKENIDWYRAKVTKIDHEKKTVH